MRRRIAIGLVLILIPTYIAVAQGLPVAFRSTCAPDPGSARVTDQVGFCERIGFSVQRSYYLGLFRLPVYGAGINLDLVNRLFLPVLLGIAGLLWWRGRPSERPGTGDMPRSRPRETGRDDDGPERMTVAVRDA